MTNRTLISDFWWLQSDVNHSTYQVGFGHHTPITDSVDPASVHWCCPLDNKPVKVLDDPCLHLLVDLGKARQACDNTNIYRTLKLFDSSGIPVLLGPFVIDIDNSDLQSGVYVHDLHDALKVTRALVEILFNDWDVPKNDIRVYLSGRKGFNVEVRPDAVGITGSVGQHVTVSGQKLDAVISQLRVRHGLPDSTYANQVSSQGTIIDRTYGHNSSELRHPYLRLRDSVNKWISDDKETARIKLQVDLASLNTATIDQLCRDSERLAADS